LGHQFSYTPPDRDEESEDSSSSSSSSENENVDESDDNDPVAEIETKSDISKRRVSVTRQLDDETDFVVEEISDDDIGYDDETEQVQPDETEDAESEEETTEPVLDQEDILDALKNLKCGGLEEQEKAQEFEEKQRERYRKKKNRWSLGGTKKRSHAQSVGSDQSDNADIEPLDDLNVHDASASARRLRRRTYGREDAERPNRNSLLLERPPAEIEELDLSSHPASDDAPSSSDDEADEEDSDDDDEEELIADEDMLVPAWLMEIDSDPSRPSTAG
jgi:hypothetical protein